MLTSAATAENFAVDESELGIGNLLVQTGKLSVRDLERAIAAGEELRGRLSHVLVQLGLVSEVDVAQARSSLLGLPFVSADSFPETYPDVEGLQPAFLRSHRVLPIAAQAGRVDVVMADPQDKFVLKALHLATGLEIRPFLAMGSDIDKALALRDAGGAIDPGDADGLEDVDSGDFVEHLKDLASEAPVIRLVNTIVGRVIDVRASDIHLEPFENGLHVRYRVDGVLQEADLLPVKQGAAVVSRIKLLAHIDIAERRLPQDGRIRTRVKGRELDLRISTVPTVPAFA
jgi:general secretion pathway protein E